MEKARAADKISNRLKELEIERNELQTALRVLNRFTDVDKSNLVYPDVAIDFTGAGNIRERLVRIAEAVPRPLEARDMALCLIQRGLSGAQLRNLQSHIINKLRDDPDFVKYSTGSYEYLPSKASSSEYSSTD